MSTTFINKLKLGFNLRTILITALLVRIVLFIIFRPWTLEFETHELFYYDQQEYHELAKALLGWDFLDNTIRTPGYPLFIAFFYWLFGVYPAVVLAVQSVMVLFSVFMTYRIARLFFTEKTALLAGLMLAFDPHLIIFSFNLLSEALFVPVFLVMSYFLIRFLQTNRLKNLILASVFLALSAYIRPVTLYLPFALLPLIFIFSKGSSIDKLKSWGILVILFFLILSPWYIRNQVKFDRWGFCTTGGYNMLFVYGASIDYANQNGGDMEEVWQLVAARVDSLTGGDNRNPFKVEDAQMEVGLQMVKSDPLVLVQNHFIGVFNIFFSISSYRISRILGIDEKQLDGDYYGTTNLSRIEKFIQEKSLFSIMISGLMLLLFIAEYSTAIVGVIFLGKKKNFIVLFTFLLIIIYLLGLTGLFGFQARFKLPIMPFYLIFSAYGIHVAREWYLKRKKVKTV